MSTKRPSRRDFLKATAPAVGASILAACGAPAAAPSVASSTAAPPAGGLRRSQRQRQPPRPGGRSSRRVYCGAYSMTRMSRHTIDWSISSRKRPAPRYEWNCTGPGILDNPVSGYDDVKGRDHYHESATQFHTPVQDPGRAGDSHTPQKHSTSLPRI